MASSMLEISILEWVRIHFDPIFALNSTLEHVN